MIKHFYLTQKIEPYQVLPLQASGPEGNNKGVLCIPPKLQHYLNLTIRLFNVISRTLIRGVLHLCRNSVGVFYSPSQLGWLCDVDSPL